MMFCKKQQERPISKNDRQCAGRFDNPLIDQKFDLLERKAVANNVYAYLTKLDPEWSVRVGLIAPWGEGKTTVGEWVAVQALKEGISPSGGAILGQQKLTPSYG